MAAEWVMLTMKTSAMTTSIDEAGRILLPQLALHDDDLNWKDLGYAPVPLPPSAQVTIRIEQRGKLLPMAHELDDEPWEKQHVSSRTNASTAEAASK